MHLFLSFSPSAELEFVLPSFFSLPQSKENQWKENPGIRPEENREALHPIGSSFFKEKLYVTWAKYCKCSHEFHVRSICYLWLDVLPPLPLCICV
jgi:hypothetical protein